MENFCREVLFCDTVTVCRTVAERYSFVIGSQCEELLQEDIVLCCGASVGNSCRKVSLCDSSPERRTVAARYCFVIQSQCLELLQEGIVL